MAFNNVPGLVMYRNSSGVWNVDPVKIDRPGLETFRVDANRNPESTDPLRGLPRGRPFRCGPCTNNKATGVTSAMLEFTSSFIGSWHNSDSMAFDDGARTVRVWMKVDGAPDEPLLVPLSCKEMPHSRPQPQPTQVLQALVHGITAIALHVFHFFLGRFLTPRAKVSRKSAEEELAAEGPNGASNG